MNPNLDSEEYYHQSREYFGSCQYDQSLVLCKRAVTTKSNHYNAHFYWGRNLYSKDADSKAVRKHRELISRDPMDCDAYHNLGVTFDKQDKLFEAEAQYKKSLEINSSDNDSSHNLAIVLTKQAKYTEALQQYEKNIRNNPSDSSTYNCYGYLKFTLGKYEGAIESFEEAMIKNPKYSLPFINKSLALHCLGNLELAVEIFKESLGKVGDDESWQTRFQKNLSIYQGELSRSEKILESGDLGEMNRENLVMNIKALHFIVDSLKEALTKTWNQENNNE